MRETKWGAVRARGDPKWPREKQERTQAHRAERSHSEHRPTREGTQDTLFSGRGDRERLPWESRGGRRRMSSDKVMGEGGATDLSAAARGRGQPRR